MLDGSSSLSRRTIIIGAGPAGLSVAYEFKRHGIESTVLEQSMQAGGLSRTESYRGFLFDIGGHRFFTKVAVVEQMWRDVLGKDLLVRPRLSRVFYGGKFYSYPLEPLETVLKLGVWESFLSMLSYAKAKLFPPAEEKDLESWLIRRFGVRLYRRFFKTYTEKVWGMPCSEIGAEWAAQRIRGLSVGALVKSVLGKMIPGMQGPKLKTLIDEFLYPRLGPGMMWEKTAELVGNVQYGLEVEGIHWERGGVKAVEAGGRRWEGEQFVSTMPMRRLVECLQPAGPEYLNAVKKLRYRDFVTVALILRVPNPFEDNWIYVHDEGVKVGRIQNFKNWSAEMVPDPELTCLGMEYFVFEGDEFWTSSDETLLEQAERELVQLGLAKAGEVIDGKVIREKKAYPVYDENYAEAVAAVKRFLSEEVPNLQCAGRNGMHRYNNQDHSMLTGVLAARNIMKLGTFDLWDVNADEDYHEDGFRLSEESIREMERMQPKLPNRVGEE
jgi:protoporphyrinogen oxidase